jgi:hypothetical protein
VPLSNMKSMPCQMNILLIKFSYLMAKNLLSDPYKTSYEMTQYNNQWEK